MSNQEPTYNSIFNGGGALKENINMLFFEEKLPPPLVVQFKLNKKARQALMRAQKKTWQVIQGERVVDEQLGNSIVRHCSLAMNGERGKGSVKSQGKITVRHMRDEVYKGGSKVFTQQDGWHSSRSWLLKKKFRQLNHKQQYD